MANHDAEGRRNAVGPKPDPGSPRYYDWIAVVLFSSLAICCACLLFLNLNSVEVCVQELFGTRKAFILQMYFWAALGATITSYKFFADDKDRNELECLKDNPDPKELRWPNSQDVILYIQRILMSGAMGIIGVAVLLAGLGIFDTAQQEWSTKQKMVLAVFCAVVGMYQADFLAFVAGIKEQFFKANPPETPQPKGNGAGREQLDKIRSELRTLVKDEKHKTTALKWIAEKYPADNLAVAYKSFDYSNDPEIFIAHPPGEKQLEILTQLRKQF